MDDVEVEGTAGAIAAKLVLLRGCPRKGSPSSFL